MAMALKDALAQMKSLGEEKVRTQNRSNGAGDDQFGVRLGDIRKLAAKSSPTTHWPSLCGARGSSMPACWRYF